MDPARLRRDLLELLEGGHAHLTVKKALAGLPPRNRAARPGRGLHTIWETLEHMRLTQEDILRYTLDPGWRSPQWPEGYWPAVKRPTAAQWKRAVEAFESDLAEVMKMARDPRRDLTAHIPHGEGRSYLREVLLVADHNAYHLAQIVDARRLLGDWK